MENCAAKNEKNNDKIKDGWQLEENDVGAYETFKKISKKTNGEYGSKKIYREPTAKLNKYRYGDFKELQNYYLRGEHIALQIWKMKSVLHV